jgi:ComF family protein
MKALLNLLAPQYCIICIEKTRSLKALCDYCEHCLPWIGENCCDSCALPLHNSETQYCGICATNSIAFNRTLSAFIYIKPIDKWIKQLKFKHQYGFAKTLGQFLIKKIKADSNYTQIEAIIPIPIHYRRWLSRGYNQSALIAKHVGSALSISVDYKLLKKIKHTPPQVKLSKKKRHSNMTKSFYAKSTDYKRVAIIDDVMTTRSTAHHAAKALRQAGINYIEVWCIARSI